MWGLIIFLVVVFGWILCIKNSDSSVQKKKPNRYRATSGNNNSVWTSSHIHDYGSSYNSGSSSSSSSGGYGGSSSCDSSGYSSSSSYDSSGYSGSSCDSGSYDGGSSCDCGD
ncbi:MAG: hypothetical protein EA343_22005 [Nodularia sp. (in: Bacteria)]|nr:MAG: hypothetical protein EA343_22005 [Nodularia sp. (in: cyanobacteria)]